MGCTHLYYFQEGWSWSWDQQFIMWKCSDYEFFNKLDIGMQHYTSKVVKKVKISVLSSCSLTSKYMEDSQWDSHTLQILLRQLLKMLYRALKMQMYVMMMSVSFLRIGNTTWISYPVLSADCKKMASQLTNFKWEFCQRNSNFKRSETFEENVWYLTWAKYLLWT